MASTIALLNYLLAIGGIVLAVSTALLFFDLYSKNLTFSKLIQKWGLAVALLTTVGSSIMTLVYSEIFGFVPCGLCWLQRACLYPQTLLLTVALYRKDKTVALYGIALSIPGIIVSVYQHYLQMGGTEFVTCPVTSAGADCAERILFEFGFMTFPLMSTFLFTFLIALYWYLWKTK